MTDKEVVSSANPTERQVHVDLATESKDKGIVDVPDEQVGDEDEGEDQSEEGITGANVKTWEDLQALNQTQLEVAMRAEGFDSEEIEGIQNQKNFQDEDGDLDIDKYKKQLLRRPFLQQSNERLLV